MSLSICVTVVHKSCWRPHAKWELFTWKTSRLIDDGPPIDLHVICTSLLSSLAFPLPLFHSCHLAVVIPGWGTYLSEIYQSNVIIELSPFLCMWRFYWNKSALCADTLFCGLLGSRWAVYMFQSNSIIYRLETEIDSGSSVHHAPSQTFHLKNGPVILGAKAWGCCLYSISAVVRTLIPLGWMVRVWFSTTGLEPVWSHFHWQKTSFLFDLEAYLLCFVCTASPKRFGRGL